MFYHVEEARSALLVVEAVLSEKEFLGMASNLGRSPRGDEIAGYSPPISLSKFLQTS